LFVVAIEPKAKQIYARLTGFQYYVMQTVFITWCDTGVVQSVMSGSRSSECDVRSRSSECDVRES